jgi:histidine triad (HIT) family protein
MDCLFCKIANGELPSKMVYEDELVSGFLDINPHTNGNSLIVPKKHYLDYKDISDELNNHINEVIKKLDKMYQEKLGSKGLTIIHNSGCGQEVKHYHVHFIPRYENTDISLVPNRELEDIEKVYQKLMK